MLYMRVKWQKNARKEKTLRKMRVDSFFFITFALAKREVGPIVQWIEQISPKELMRFCGYNIEIVKIDRQLE